MRISKMVCGVLAAVVAMAATLSSATAGECPLSKKAVKVQAVKLAEKKDIVDTAVGAKSFTTLVAAVKAAGLVETLKSKGPFTVFAPTDEAFKKLPEGTVESLLKPESTSHTLWRSSGSSTLSPAGQPVRLPVLGRCGAWAAFGACFV